MAQIVLGINSETKCIALKAALAAMNIDYLMQVAVTVLSELEKGILSSALDD